VPAAALVGGLVFGVLFIHRQRTYASPLIEIRLFRDPTFSTAILIKSVTLFALAGISLFAHQFVQLVLGLRPLTAALWSFTVFPAIMIAVQVTGALATRVKPVNIIATGLFIMLGGFAVLAGMLDVDSPLWIVLIGAGAAATGIVMTSVVNNNMVLSAAPPERAGSASALSQTGDELGAALGLALLGTVGTAIYHRQMAATTIEGLPPAAQEVARDTLGGATAVAAQLPGELSSALLETSRVAFTHGMNWAAVLGGSVLAMTALIAMVTLRTRTTPPHANNGQHPRPRVIVVTLHAAPTRPERQPTLCSTAGFC
jgi:MFS transporter, DHA2 family, multidrug resistance protein